MQGTSLDAHLAGLETGMRSTEWCWMSTAPALKSPCCSPCHTHRPVFLPPQPKPTSKNRIGRLNQPRRHCQTHESEPSCCDTVGQQEPQHEQGHQGRDDAGKCTVWSEFYSGFGSGSDVALAKPLGVQSESPSVRGLIPFQLQLSGFSKEGWCWRLLSCPGSVRRQGNDPNPFQAPVLP